MTAWDDVRDLIDKRDADGVAALVVTLDDAAKREVAGRLPGHLKEVRLYLDPWRGAGDRAEALRAAGAGTIAAAASVASWLTRRGLVGADEQVDDTRRLLGLVRTRPHAWQAELAARLAGKLRGRGPSYELTASLIRETGIEPPTDDGFVVGWVSAAIGRGRIADVLASDPLLDTLLPRIFHAQGVGEALQWEGLPEAHTTWLGALRTLAADGRIDRAMLLDGCVSRFLRGGTPLELRFFVRLHRALAPAEREIAPRVRDYLRLLPAAPGTVAELALGHLREIPALSPGEFGEAMEALMYRPEKKLVRAGLSWLAQSIRLGPEYAGAAAGALATAFGHEASDIQEQAVRLAVRHAAHLDPAAIRDAAAALPADLRARLGVPEDPAAEAEAAPLIAPLIAPALPRAEFPPPITTAAELSAQIARFADAPYALEWRGAERLMAGLVEFAHRDRAALRASAAPLSSHPWGWRADGDPMAWLWAAFQAVASPATRSLELRLPSSRSMPAPDVLILRRMAELLDAARADDLPPVLLATPTSADGHVDPAELLSRLERLEAAGMDPAYADLQQALLRIPRHVDADVAEKAGRLTTPAGRSVARWLSGAGPADPVVTIRYGYTDGASRRWFDDGQPPRFSCSYARPYPFIAASPTGFDLIDMLSSDPDHYAIRQGGHMSWWAGTMPSHREVLAAYLVPCFDWDWPDGSPGSHILRDLAQADGPLGSASSVLLAFHLNNEDPAERTAALDVLLALAAAGDLPAAELGEQLGRLVKHGMATLSRIVPSLAEAERAGAGPQVWRTVAAALPHILPSEGERPCNGLADLIALAVKTAPPGDATPVPGLAAVAARGGSSRMVREANRLIRLLDPADHDAGTT
ncbi:DUF6493 family protein [Microbispora sp. NPDC049125]|uniref:DUF7825 domain-containing protein n=1 Tax=Microbispora sp. NPDC049125 TaxID=3154929 RepID=UPI003466A830